MTAPPRIGTLLLVVGLGACDHSVDRASDLTTASPSATSSPPAATHEGLLYGRVTTDDGAVYEGRLRWGGDEEALWGHYFNGFKDENPWAVHAPQERLPKERASIAPFGFEITAWEREADLGRPFMARFGDIARIVPRGRDFYVILKSGTTFELDRFAADDLADGLRVWDRTRGVVDLGEWGITSVELLPSPVVGAAPLPLYGTVRTGQGDFTGLIQWNREESISVDALDGQRSVRFDAIRSITRRPAGGSQVALLDGSDVVLSGTAEVGERNRGIYVDDPRYGRVLVSWDAFERVDFTPGGTGPAYDDFEPGRPLTGAVTTRSGHRLSGRLVYDLDESETTETLDAPAAGVDYTITFDLVASIVPNDSKARGGQGVRVTLHNGEELVLEAAGDLGDGNAGMLIFIDGTQAAEYVPWTDVERIDFDGPPTT